MHPRKIVRDEVKQLLEQHLDVPVFACRARELPPKTPSAVALYVTSETLQRQDDRARAPVSRAMNLAIIVLTEGEDEEATDASDELCRAIEFLISDSYTHAAPVSSSVQYDGNSKRVKVVADLNYAVEIIDNMGA